MLTAGGSAEQFRNRFSEIRSSDKSASDKYDDVKEFLGRLKYELESLYNDWRNDRGNKGILRKRNRLRDLRERVWDYRRKVLREMLKS
jgi:hypothetical protein